jgi:hypothetical protein
MSERTSNSLFVKGSGKAVLSNPGWKASRPTRALRVIDGRKTRSPLMTLSMHEVQTLEEEFLARWGTTHARDKGTIGHE